MTLIVPSSLAEASGTLALVAALLFACSVGYNLLLHPLRHYPGPKALAASRLPYTYRWLRGDLPQYVGELHRRYGPVVRVAPGELSFGDPAAWQDIMGGGSRELTKWDAFYGIPKFMPPHIQNTTDKAHHRMLRKAAAPGFSDAALRAQEGIVASHIDLMMDQLRARCGDVVDLELWSRFIVFDIIGDLALGESFGCVGDAAPHPYIKAISESGWVVSILTALNMYPVVGEAVNLFFAKIAKGGFTSMNAVLRPILQRRVASKTERLDLVNPLIMKMDEWNMTVDDMIPQAIVFIGAGSETTSSIITAATYLLLKNPDAMARAKKEVRSAFSSDGEINIERVESRVPYILACIDETLRLYPQTGSASLRITGQGNVICGKVMPPKTVVGIWAYGMYRDPELWRNPNEFHPERWLGDPEYADDRREAFNPFFTGSRDCIGRGLALMELRLIMTRLIFNFDMELQQDSRDWMERQKNLVIVWDKSPLHLVLTPAKSG